MMEIAMAAIAASTLIGLGALYFCKKAFDSMEEERRSWASERYSLLNRLQSNSLREFQSVEAPPAPRKEPEKTKDIIEQV